MLGLSKFASLVKRHGCKNIVKRYGSEFEVNGAGLGFKDVKVGVKSFSKHIIEFVKATDLAVNMDNTQYLLCKEIAQMKEEGEDKELKDDLKRIRSQILVGISHLQNIIATIKQEQEEAKKSNIELGKELREWVKYLSDLHKDAISLLGPKRKRIGKGKSAMKIAKIMRYQGIDERQLQEAINEM